MSDTLEFTINDAGWVDVSTGGLTGFMTNTGARRIVYREDNADPTSAESDGHYLLPKDSVSFSLAVGQKVWVRSASGSGKMLVTPGG